MDRPTWPGRGTTDGMARAVAWIALAPWIVFLVLRLAGVGDNQWLVAVIGATPYVAAAILLPIAIAAILRVWPAVLVGVAMAAVFAFLVLPRAFGGPTEATPPGPPLRVLAANMMLGTGSAEGLAAVVDELEPDVVSVEELTPELASELDALGFAEEFPHRNLAPAPGSHGSGLYSRYPLSDPAREIGGRYFPFLSAEVHVPGAEPVEVSSVHTVPPTVKGWAADLDAVSSAPEDGRAILLGDFNATIDHAPFRGVLDRGWNDAAATVGSGLVPTWPQDRHIFPPLYAIDHVLVGGAIGVRSFSARDVASTDHRAVFAELQLPGD
ncbi:MAG: endonuclease/exonuclease/phosphatase family protein [Solirubrobacterales bacterium]